MEIYSCYAGIEEKNYVLFSKLWSTYSAKLPKITSVAQDDIGVKATVFNCWISYFLHDEVIFLKPESSMINSNVDSIVKKLKKYIPAEMIDELYEQRQSEFFTFIYAYYAAEFISQHLNDFISTHDFFKEHPIKRNNMYLLNDAELEQSDIIFVILKILNFEFTQLYLTEQKCYELHLLALYFTKSFVKEHRLVYVK